AFERHVHRPSVLRQRGWDVMHITSLAWMRRRDEVIAEILARVPGAKGALDTEVWRRHRETIRRTGASRPPPPSSTSSTSSTVGTRAWSSARPVEPDRIGGIPVDAAPAGVPEW